MKRFLVISLAFCVMLALSACKTENDKNSSTASVTNSEEDNSQVIETKNSSENKTQQSNTHSEYVETYFVYAEQGAVVTWFDSKTGEFSYKAQCETCGKTESGTHNGLRGGHGTTYSASYSCQNTQCSEWGKLQPVKIGCEVTGEWIEMPN